MYIYSIASITLPFNVSTVSCKMSETISEREKKTTTKNVPFHLNLQLFNDYVDECIVCVSLTINS